MFLTEPSNRWKRNNYNNNNKLIGVNNNLKHISIKVYFSNGKEEMIWILMNNNRVKLRMGWYICHKKVEQQSRN